MIIDSTGYGNTPIMDISLVGGIHTISVYKTGYAPYESTVRIDEGEHRDIIANLPRLPNRGMVTILSEPVGGNLFVDGRAGGLTPVTVDSLTPGRHEILIMKTGYENYHDTISVSTDFLSTYTEYLVPLPGTGFLIVTSSPEDAEVVIDGNVVGMTPTNLQRVTYGNHTVTISKNGYWNFTGIIHIRGEEPVRVNADLTMIPTSSTLYLDSSPRGLGVCLNDTFKGFTPSTLETLPSGDYRLEFRHQSGLSFNQSFYFSPGSTHEIFATLINETEQPIIDNVWQYQNTSHLTMQPGWMTTNNTPVMEKTFTWFTSGHKATITLDIPQDLYDYYKGQPHPIDPDLDTFSAYTLNEEDRQYLHTLVNRLKDSSNSRSYEARNDYRNVVAFVQSITYENDIDPLTKQKTDYWKYPVETLADGKGDCEDTAILTAALLKEMGYEVAIVILPKHAAVAISCNNCNGYYYPFNNKQYYYLETTGAGEALGTLEKKYQAAKAILIPL